MLEKGLKVSEHAKHIPYHQTVSSATVILVFIEFHSHLAFRFSLNI